jgi:hypothetical protein
MLSSMFKQPKAPKPQELPKETPTPTVDQAANNAEEANRLRRRKGRRGYMLSRNDAAPPTTATKTALGQ